MNETILITSTETTVHTLTPTIQSATPQAVGFDIMMALRIIWYLFCVIKVISIAFFARPKPSIRQRVLRKFLISHSQLLKTFTEEDKKNMEVILDNTIKNAASRQDMTNSRIRKPTKSVIFQTEKNDYYQPKKWKEEDDNVFFDISTNNASKLHLESVASFQDKRYEQEYIEREDLIGLDEKTQEMEREKQPEEKEDKSSKEMMQDNEQTSPLVNRQEPPSENKQQDSNSPLI